jgi:NitT/TauT family transport system ATP-binding protein
MTASAASRGHQARQEQGMDLELEGVVRRFAGDVLTLDSIDLVVPAGQFLAVAGPSGCGKSTLLRLIAGLDRADAGALRIAGRPVNVRLRHRERGSPRGAGSIAFVFQHAQLLPWRTLLRNVELPLELEGVPGRERRQRALHMIEQVGLSEAVDRYPAQLSGGMQMRASLARALVTDPALLLLDEPFAALDEITRQRLDDQLYQLWQARRCTVLFVTHSLGEAVFLAQRVIMLSRRPASVCADRAIDLPEQRDMELRSSRAFNEHVRLLYQDLLVAEGQAGRRPGEQPGGRPVENQ